MALKQAKIITITSAKGGTGKTTLALSLIGLLSEEKKKILLLDADLYGCGIALSTKANPDKTLFTLVDDLKNNRYQTEEDYVTKYNEYIHILPAPKDPRLSNKISGKYLSLALSKLKTRYDYIIMDTNHIMNEFNHPVDLKNMRTIVSIFTDIEKTNYKIILNEALKSRLGYLTKYDIRHMIHDNIDYIIPSSFFIKNIDTYTLDGKIITLDKKIKTHYKKGINILEKIKASILTEEE